MIKQINPENMQVIYRFGHKFLFDGYLTKSHFLQARAGNYRAPYLTVI